MRCVFENANSLDTDLDPGERVEVHPVLGCVDFEQRIRIYGYRCPLNREQWKVRCFELPHIAVFLLTCIPHSEECLIDFRELIGEHSGENMAAAVWETVEKFGLGGR